MFDYPKKLSSKNCAIDKFGYYEKNSSLSFEFDYI